MGQLPNLDTEYQIYGFNEVLGIISVHFIASGSAVDIDVPVENGEYITGITLDNYIMSWMPRTSQPKDNRKTVKNADYIKALLTPHNKLSDGEIYLRRAMIRRRDEALKTCDWTQLPDVQAVMPEEEKQLWVKFRQELRDITEQPGYPHDVKWPQRPYMMGLVIYD